MRIIFGIGLLLILSVWLSQPVTHFVFSKESDGALPYYMRVSGAIDSDICNVATVKFNLTEHNGAKIVRGSSYCERHSRAEYFGAVVINVTVQIFNWARGYPGCMDFSINRCREWKGTLKKPSKAWGN